MAVTSDLCEGADGRPRCWWAVGSPTLERYHDLEWGTGPRDERGLFERLSLEALQAGLSWRIVLERRDALRVAFRDFRPETLARFGPRHVDRLLATPGTIRNRAKTEAILANARLLADLHQHGSGLLVITEGALADLPARSGPAPRSRAEVPASTPGSELLARRLRTLGWRFVGPTTAYAYLQACGWVDDHLVGCAARGAPLDASTLR